MWVSYLIFLCFHFLLCKTWMTMLLVVPTWWGCLLTKWTIQLKCSEEPLALGKGSWASALRTCSHMDRVPSAGSLTRGLGGDGNVFMEGGSLSAYRVPAAYKEHSSKWSFSDFKTIIWSRYYDLQLTDHELNFRGWNSSLRVTHL